MANEDEVMGMPVEAVQQDPTLEELLAPTELIPGQAPPAEGQPAQGQPGPGGGGSAGGGAGGGIFSEYEQMLMDRMEAMDDQREKAKWLAVAEFGFNLMASDRATLGESAGEAGAAALQSYREQMAQFDQDEMDTQEALMGLKLSRAKMASAGSGGGGGGSSDGLGIAGLSTEAKRDLDVLRYGIDITKGRLSDMYDDFGTLKNGASEEEANQLRNRIAALEDQYWKKYFNYGGMAPMTLEPPEEQPEE